jgi:prepilin-type N-terminal cleavage/methylation domain-containing protein
VNRRGVTLIEMMIVVVIVGLIVAISFPSASAGLDGIRLRSAADSVVGLLNAALTRTDRRQEPMEVIISPKERTISLFTADPSYTKKLQLPDGIVMAGEEPRRFLLMPGGAPPTLDIDLSNSRGTHKVVRIDPITGVPQS